MQPGADGEAQGGGKQAPSSGNAIEYKQQEAVGDVLVVGHLLLKHVRLAGPDLVQDTHTITERWLRETETETERWLREREREERLRPRAARALPLPDVEG